MRYLGIDPGIGGAIAAVNSRGAVTFVEPMPAEMRDIGYAIEQAIAGQTPRAVLEHVWSMQGWGHAGSFTFGRVFGRLEGALDGAGVLYDLVVPRVWQPMMGVVIPAGTKSTARKNLSKARAAELFPTLTVTHATADALLIAEYCRRLCLGRLNSHSAIGVTHGKAQASRQNDAAEAARGTKAGR